MRNVHVTHLIAGGVQVPEESDIEPGTVPLLTLQLVEGLALPIPDPNNPGQPIVIPAVEYSFGLAGETAIQIGTRLVEGGEKLPKPSRIAVASNVQGVEAVADRLASLRNGQ